jgi:predicted nucleic acid-binding protein
MAGGQAQVSAPRRLVLDANILLRGVFGVRVRGLLEAYEDAAAFYSPDLCFEEARKYIPELAARRAFDPVAGLEALNQLARVVEVVDRSLYEEYEEVARERITSRDSADWPVVATSLLLDCPVWTEDQDFFGSGIATWTTSTIEVYLRST